MTTKKTADAVNELEAFFARQELATAPAWRPEPGESLFGEIVGFRAGQGDHGDYPIVIVRTEFGPRAIHAFHTLMRDGFREINAKKGMRIGVTYKGVVVKNDAADIPEEKREKTDTYHMYFVMDMDKLAEQPEEEVTF